MTKQQAKDMEEKIKDKLLYLHINHDSRGESIDMTPEEYAEEDWKDIKTLLKYAWSLGYEEGLKQGK